MKNTIKLFALVLFISTMSCNNPNEQTEKNIAMYSAVWDEIINNEDLDKINDTNFDQNITLVTYPENVVGIENFKAYYSNFVTGFSEDTFTVVDVFGQGDKLVKHWKFTGKHTGDFFGIPATGKTVDIEGTTLITMKDGKIAQEQDFMDNLIFMEQLGINPFLNPNNAAVVQKLYDDFAKGDVDSVLAAMDPNIIWNEAEGNSLADGNPYIGPEAVLTGVFTRVGEQWDNFKLVNIKLHDMSDNQVLATLRYNATVKATGKKVDAQVAHHWKLNNEKIVSFQQHVDTKQLAESEE